MNKRNIQANCISRDETNDLVTRDQQFKDALRHARTEFESTGMTRTQIRAVACTLRKISDKIDQGGRYSGLEILPELHQILPQGNPPRTQELISTHLREIARRGLRTDALEAVYAINDVTAEMQYQSQLLRSAATDLEEGKINLDEVQSIILGFCYARGFNLRRKRDFWSNDPDGYGRYARQSNQRRTA
jgi:hypothetical protein